MNETALSHDKVYVINAQVQGISHASAQASYIDGTPATVSFKDGSASTGSLLISDLSGLTTAYATDTLTVSGASPSLKGASVAFSGVVLREGVDWSVGATTHLSAVKLTAAINAKVLWASAVENTSVITITARGVGSYYNSMTLSSKNAGIAAGSALFTGGQDNAIAYVNGTALRVGPDWHVGATSATAATNLAAAIVANSDLNALLTVTANSPSAGYVALSAKTTGAATNYTLGTSLASALTVSGAKMTGGAASAYSTGSPLIHAVAHGLTTGMKVLYGQGIATLAPLIDQTTYFAIRIDDDNVELASTSANAIAGTAIILTGTPSASATYTLAPPAIAGNTSLLWQVSNDGITYTDMAGQSTTTISTYGSASTTWDLGLISNTYFQLKVTAPTSGGVKLKVIVAGSPLEAFVPTAGGIMTGQLTMTNAPIVQTGALGTITSAGAIQGASLKTTGAFFPLVLTKAQILDKTPSAVGETYFCSDCTAISCSATDTTKGHFAIPSNRLSVCN